MNLINNLPSTGNVLFISNGCGNGHIQTVNSLKAQLMEARPEMHSTTIDVYKNSFGNWIGERVIEKWSLQQKEGDIAALNNYLKYWWVEGYILSIFTFFNFVGTLLKNDIDVVVNVQPFGSSALLSAVRVVNFIRKFFCCQERNPITVSMVLTELPNVATRNFFPGIKALSPSDHQLFTLYTTDPLLEPGETDEEFWKTHCGLSMENVVYDALPVRQAFFDQVNQPRPTSLTVKVDTDENRKQMLACCEGATALETTEGLTFDLAPEDRLLSIHLGGQACVAAATGYLLSRIQDETPRAGKEYVFILCGDNNSSDSLFAQVVDIVKQNPLPDGLHVVPLTRQTDVEIAPLLARSDAAIIKSGGLTSMEVFTVSPSRILIHSMCSQDIVDEDEMIQKGMPVWEGGNARYLMAKKAAQVVTTQTIGNNIYV